MFPALFLCIAASALAPSTASEGPPPVLQPATYTSRSGEYRLRVEPSARQGEGPGTCTLRQGERTLWSAELPYTFWRAAVSDEGHVFGYAYTHGSRDYRAEGRFVVALLARDGREIAKESTQRTMSRMLHSAPDPVAFGCFVHDELGLGVVRVREEHGRETWRTYRLADGEPAGVYDPERGLARPDDVVRSMDARAVPGTPLVVTWFWHRKGVLFTLADADGTVVWQLHRRDDPRDHDMDGASAILDVSRERRFALWHVRDGERVEYEVARGAAARDGVHGDAPWVVQEVARSPEPWLERTRPTKPEWPAIELEPLVSVPLRRGAADGPIRDVAAFALRLEGVEFVRREGAGAYTLVQLDEAGAALRERPVTAGDGEHAAVRWHPLADGAWLLIESDYGVGGRGRIARLEVGSHTLEPLAALDCPSIEAVAELPGGALALLATERSEYTMSDLLLAVERDGTRRWVVRESLQPGSKLFSPSDIAATRDGRIAVVCTISNVMEVYGQDGAHQITIDLAEAWGREPRYPADVSIAPDGRVLVEDARDTEPSTWTMALDGSVIASFVPRLPDGKRIAGEARFAADNRVWGTDGRCFMRLDDAGEVDRVVGSLGSAERLDVVGSLALDRAGRALVQDQRSGSVHVFDATTGEPAFVCRPAPGDFAEGRAVRSSIATAPDGRVLLTGLRGGAYLAFDPSGERLGPLDLGGGNVAFVPGSGRRWCQVEGDLVLRDADGRELAEIDRDPDGRWFTGRGLVSSDGRLCTVGAGYVALHGPTGERLSTIAVGESLAPYLHLGVPLAFEGEWVVVGDHGGTATLVHLTDGAVRSFVFRAPRPPACTFALSAAGDELWALAADDLVLHRFALPE